MKFLLCLLCSFLVNASEISERNRTGARSPLPQIVIPSSFDSTTTAVSDDDIVCNAALNFINQHKLPSVPDMEKYVKQVIQEDRTSPIFNEVPLRQIADDIKNIASQTLRSASPNYYLQELIIKAHQKALEDQQVLLFYAKKEIDARVSKLKTAFISTLCTAVFGSLSTVLVKYNTSC